MPNRVEAAEKLERKINAWLRDHLILQLAGVLGEKCCTREAECKVTRPRGSVFLSDTFFANIRFPGSSLTELSVVVKLLGQNEDADMRQYNAGLFDNEILFYQKVVDSKSEEYPKCYLAGADPVFGKVLVLENVSYKGYFISPNKLNMSVDYVLAGLQSIARYHSHTYTMKEKTPEMFNQIVKDIKLLRYDKDNPFMKFVEHLNFQMHRVTKGLQARNYDPEFTKQIEDLFQDTYKNIMIRCVEPVEPLATIVHGDCTQNNIMFQKVDREGCGGLNAMLIDFALMMYTSPATDISLLIYMCLSREDIKAYTKTLFKAYHDTLMQNMKKRNIWLPDKYNYEAFWKDYKQHALLGYITTVFFLPLMAEFENNNEILQMDEEVISEAYEIGGGEDLTNALVDMLIDARKAGLLDFYLNINTADV